MKNVIRIIYHMIGFGVFLSLAEATIQGPKELFLYGTINAVIAGVCFLVRLKAKKILSFLGIHFGILALGIYFVGVLAGNGTVAFMFGVTIFWSILLRFLKAAKWLDNPNAIYVGTMVVVYFIHWVYKAPQYIKTVTVIATVVLFLLKQLYQNIDAADRFVDLRAVSTQMNTKSVKSLSKQLSLIYVGIMGVLLGTLGVIGIDSVWEFLGNMGNKLMRYLVSLIPEGKPPVHEQTFDKVNNNSVGGLEELAQESPIMQMIGEIVAYIGGVIIFCAFAFLLVRGIILLVRFFQNRENEVEEQLVREKLYVGKERTMLKRRRLFQREANTPAKKVRKIYKKEMSKLDEKSVVKFVYMNPEEQVDCIPTHRIDDNVKEEIRELYEKARYSAEVVSDVDVKRMNALM